MTNIAKHAGAHSVSVSLSAVTDEKYRLRIENDGNAFSAAMAADATNKQGGIGIRKFKTVPNRYRPFLKH